MVENHQSVRPDDTFSLLDVPFESDARHLAMDKASNEAAPHKAHTAPPDERGVEDEAGAAPQANVVQNQVPAEPRANEEGVDYGEESNPTLLVGVGKLRAVAARSRQPPMWGHVRRHQVSLMLGPPGIGKSQYAAQAAIAMAAKRPFAGHTPTGAYRVVFLSPEDEADILIDRIEAMAKILGADMSLVERNLRIVHHDGSCALFEPGAHGVRLTDMGRTFFTEVEEFGADVVCLDPMAELHRLPEMDNGAMNALMSRFRTRAREGNFAVVLTHHTAKPDSADKPPTIHAARGASATAAACRHAEIFTELGKKEKEDFAITEEMAPDYVRRDTVKASYARRPGQPTYFKRVEVAVNGGTAPALEMVKLVKKAR